LRRYKLSKVYDFGSFTSQLYEILLEKAFGEGWDCDLAILKQSKVKLKGWVLDTFKDTKTVSFDAIAEDVERNGGELPEAFIVQPTQYHDLWLKTIRVEAGYVADTPIKTAIVEVLMGE